MPPIVSLSSHQPLMGGTQALDTGSCQWTYVLSALSAMLLCLFGLYGLGMPRGPRPRRRNRRGSNVELGTGAAVTGRRPRPANCGSPPERRRANKENFLWWQGSEDDTSTAIQTDR